MEGERREEEGTQVIGRLEWRAESIARDEMRGEVKCVERILRPLLGGRGEVSADAEL